MLAHRPLRATRRLNLPSVQSFVAANGHTLRKFKSGNSRYLLIRNRDKQTAKCRNLVEAVDCVYR